MLMGHPDKVCDQVADAIMDEFLRRDDQTRGSVYVFGGHGAMMISGSIASRADFDCAEIAKRVYKQVGYEDEVEPFVHLGVPTDDWLQTVAKTASRAQAVCYGYATNKTREMLPPAQVYAQTLARKIDEARVHDQGMHWLRPDGRVLVAMNGAKVTHITIFCQHAEDAKVQDVQGNILERIVRPVIGDMKDVKLFVNTTGVYLSGGLSTHTGQSGRRTASDLYGGLMPHGGEVITGRDPAHPSRSGFYMARHIAKALVKTGKASQVFVTLMYTIGRVDPVLFDVRGDRGEDLTSVAKERFDLRIEKIVEQFKLRRPIYRNLSTYGPFGRTDAPWEDVGMAVPAANSQ